MLTEKRPSHEGLVITGMNSVPKHASLNCPGPVFYHMWLHQERVRPERGFSD